MQIGLFGTSQQNPLDCKNYQAGWNRPIVLTYPSVPHNMDVKNNPFFLDTLFQFFFTVSITFKSKVWMSFLEIISLDVHFFVQFSTGIFISQLLQLEFHLSSPLLEVLRLPVLATWKYKLKNMKRIWLTLCRKIWYNCEPVVVPALGLRPLSVGDPP